MLSRSMQVDQAPPVPYPPPPPTDALVDLRTEMAVWAEPVVADRIFACYGGWDLSAAARSLLAIHHRRMWRALILDQRTAAEQIWLALERDLQRVGLDAGVADDIDAAVLDELMDIVVARYRYSRAKTKGYGRVLLAAAAQTGAVRPSLAS